MTAIAGLIRFERRPPAREEISRMLGVLSHRGGSSEGAWAEGPAAIGACSSATLSYQPSEPSVLQRGDFVLVADARIDNLDEVASALGPCARHASQRQILLLAYERWGAGCAERLIGDFALAIWNRRTRLLFCARDPMGVRPLYVHQSRGLVAFASEIKALLVLPEVPRDLDTDEMSRFLDAKHEDRRKTLYTQIQRLPAAHTLVVTAERTVQAEYWRPDPHRKSGCSSPEEYVEAFRSLFTIAVEARMRNVSTIGATLSGGLDSSAVASVARRIAGTSGAALHTFSLTFEGLGAEDLRRIDERQFQASVTREGGLHPHAVRGDALSPLRDLDRVLWHLDEPHFAPNLYLHLGLFSAARDHGVDVLLDGFDGDSAVSHGFGRLNGLARAGDWDAFEFEVRAFANRRGIAPERVLTQFGLPFLRELAQAGRVAAWRRAARELRRRFGLSGRTLLTEHGVRPFVKRNAERAQSESEMHVQGLSQPLYQLTLEVADKSSRAFGVEARYPFFDRRLIDFCVTVPDELKFSEGWPRLLFRRAMEGVLPREVQWRASKASLAPCFHRGFRSTDRAMVEEAVGASAALPIDCSDLPAVRDRYFSDAGWHGHEADGYRLFRATVLHRWLATREPLAPAADSFAVSRIPDEVCVSA
jgi:asparagine synthase (glutamine-hydrolysing)